MYLCGVITLVAAVAVAAAVNNLYWIHTGIWGVRVYLVGAHELLGITDWYD